MRTIPSSGSGAARLGVAATLFFATSTAFAAPTKASTARTPITPTSSNAVRAPALGEPRPATPDAAGPEAAPLAAALQTHDPVGTSHAEAPPTPGREAASQEDAALTEREGARSAAGRIEVAVSGSLEVGSRHFTYSDPVGRLLAPYHLNVVPMASFGLEAYPLTSTNLPVLRDLGFRGRYSRAFAVDSRTPDGATINTSWSRFGGEVRERLLVPGARPIELGLYVGAEASYFDLSTKSKVAAFPPRARTISIRFGIDARILVAWRLSALLSAAYLAVTERGEIYDRFRDPTVNGVDSELGCALSVLPGLEARLTGRYTRYFATFEPKLGDLAVAGGALDEQVQVGVGARYAH